VDDGILGTIFRKPLAQFALTQFLKESTMNNSHRRSCQQPVLQAQVISTSIHSCNTHAYVCMYTPGLTLLGLEPHQYPMVFAKLDYTNSGKVRIDDWLKLPNIIVHDDRSVPPPPLYLRLSFLSHCIYITEHRITGRRRGTI